MTFVRNVSPLVLGSTERCDMYGIRDRGSVVAVKLARP